MDDLSTKVRQILPVQSGLEKDATDKNGEKVASKVASNSELKAG